MFSPPTWSLPAVCLAGWGGSFIRNTLYVRHNTKLVRENSDGFIGCLSLDVISDTCGVVTARLEPDAVSETCR
jgi:hypothetical protein